MNTPVKGNDVIIPIVHPHRSVRQAKANLGRIARHHELAKAYRVQLREDGVMTWYPLEVDEDLARWVPVKDGVGGFPGYEASDTGYIRRADTRRLLIPRAPSDNPHDCGSLVVRLRIDQADYELNGYGPAGTQCVARSVAVLILESFGVPHASADDIPGWADGDKTNNALENLFWRPREELKENLR